MKSNLLWYIEGQTHFSTSWHAKISLTLNDPIEDALSANLQHYLQACTKISLYVEGVVLIKQPTTDHTPIELMNSSNGLQFAILQWSKNQDCSSF